MNPQSSELAKSINDYLNHYVVVNDGKAVAIGTASLVIVGLVVAPDAIKHADIFAWLGVASAAMSAAFAGSVIYPRTPRSQVGHLFWVDICSFGSANAYWKSLDGLSEQDIRIEYARQNYNVSKVLIKKTLGIRVAMCFLGAACVLVGFAYWRH